MELRQIRYFLAVAKHRHFTRASAELNIVQPALSQQIRRLERELGSDLFDRRGGHVELTMAGRTFLEGAARVIVEVDLALAAMRQFSDASTGRVAIGALRTLAYAAIDFPSLLTDFSAQYPGVQVMFVEDVTSNLVTELRNGHLDVALVDAGLIDDASDLIIDPITVEDNVLLVGPDHRLAGRESCSLEDLAGEAFVRLGPESEARMRLVKLAEVLGFRPNFAFMASNLDLARTLVSRGLGVYFTHPWVTEREGPPVWALKLVPSAMETHISIARLRNGYRSAAVDAFLSFSWDKLHFRGPQPGERPSPPDLAREGATG
jgi:LysR family hydrogen peroxide-inducible transcriptional activator